MKKYWLLAITFMITLSAQAGTLNLDMRTDYNSTTFDKSTQSDSTRFYLKTGRLDYQGKAMEDLSFRARLAFNKDATRNSPDNTQVAAEYAYLTHKLNQNLSLTVGKFNTELGGFEGGTNSADLYLTSEAYTHKSPKGDLASNLFGTTDLLYLTGVKATYSAESQTLHVLATNESEDSKSGVPANQNSSLIGVIWRGALMEKALNFNLSYHTVNGAAKNDKFQFLGAGAQWISASVLAQLDYLIYDFKQDSSGKKDQVTSIVGKVAYTGWENWTPRVELTASEETIEVGSKTKNKYMGAGAVLELKPHTETNFRYHLAYSNVKMEPETGDSSVKQEVVLGARLMADFLK